MDEAGEGSSKKGKRKQDGGKKPAKKPKARTPTDSSSVTQVIQQLKEIVAPDSDIRATKKEVLQQSKEYILHLETTLLNMKGPTLAEDSSPCSLDAIKDEFLQLLSDDQGDSSAAPVVQDEMDPVILYMHPVIKKDLEDSVEELKMGSSAESFASRDIMEFERYMLFYKQTADMLVENQVVSPGQVTHPVVSKAISNQWQELLQDGKANIYERFLSQARNAAACPFACCSDSGCANGGKRDSGVESQEASSSFLSSTPEEILLDDAFELAAGYLDCSANQTLPNPGCPMHESSLYESLEEEKQLSQNVSDFLRAQISFCTQASALHCDEEAVLLRCTETFDDEDDF